jgi:hypothetical protein
MTMANDSGGKAILGLVVCGLLAFVALVFAFGWTSHDATHTASLDMPKISTTR